jgi:MoaA/NifB/PqqE/SkfB family radical SAM enzyme
MDYAFLCERIVPWLERVQPQAVRLTGGEPTEHPSFLQIARKLREVLRGYLVLNTHGGTLIRHLNEIKYLFDAYIISLDSPDPEGYRAIRGVDWFNKVIRLPREIHLISQRIHVAFSTVIQKRNVCEISRIAQLARTTDANMITFNIPTLVDNSYQNTGNRLLKQKGLIIPSGQQIDLLHQEIGMLGNLRKDWPSNFILQSQATLEKYVELLRAWDAGELDRLGVARCGVPFSSLTINFNGSLKPCFILPHSKEFSTEAQMPDLGWLHRFRSRYLSDDDIIKQYCKNCYVYPYVLSGQDI